MWVSFALTEESVLVFPFVGGAIVQIVQNFPPSKSRKLNPVSIAGAGVLSVWSIISILLNLFKIELSFGGLRFLVFGVPNVWKVLFVPVPDSIRLLLYDERIGWLGLSQLVLVAIVVFSILAVVRNQISLLRIVSILGAILVVLGIAGSPFGLFGDHYFITEIDSVKIFFLPLIGSILLLVGELQGKNATSTTSPLPQIGTFMSDTPQSNEQGIAQPSVSGTPPTGDFVPPAAMVGQFGMMDMTTPTYRVQVIGAGDRLYSIAELQQMAMSKVIKAETLVQHKDANYPVQASTIPSVFSSRQWLTTMLLSFFLGSLGVDRFYLGYTGIGVAKLLTLGGCGVWSLIDFILIAMRNVDDVDGRPLS